MKGKRLSARVNSVPEITCHGSLLTNDMNGKLLGLEIDEELSFSSMLTPFVRKLHSASACYKKIMNYLPLKQKVTFLQCLDQASN